MYKDTVVSFSHPDRISIEDPLTQVLRLGARRLLADAVEAEVEAFIAAHAGLADGAGRRRVVRHGYQPEREVPTGIGAVAVRRPRVRDRQPDAGRGRIRFTSSILPPYLRRAKSVEELLAWLYLKGISTGDFGEALAALLGPDAPGLSATPVIRLKTASAEEYERWLRRDLPAKRYVALRDWTGPAWCKVYCIYAPEALGKIPCENAWNQQILHTVPLPLTAPDSSDVYLCGQAGCWCSRCNRRPDVSLTGSAKGRVVERGSDLDPITAEKCHVQSEFILPLTNHFPCEWLWIEAWTAANFCRVFTSLNLAIAASRRRNGWCEFSARLLSQRPQVRAAALPITVIAAR